MGRHSRKLTITGADPGAAKDLDQPAADSLVTRPQPAPPARQAMTTQPTRLAAAHRTIRTLPRDSHGPWQQQVHLSRGHWRREDAAGAIRSAGWWESIAMT